jgi:hypothetical protein
VLLGLIYAFQEKLVRPAWQLCWLHTGAVGYTTDS